MGWRYQEDLILDSAPRLYASGIWPRIFVWVRELGHRCVVITCSDTEFRWPDNATPYFLKSNDRRRVQGKTWQERHREALSLVREAIDDNASVLVHCQRGLHRTGSFITLWVALCMRAREASVASVASVAQRPWLQVLSDAWQHFKTRRQLRERSWAGRDYETESWQAVVELYGNVDPDEFMASVAPVVRPKARPKKTGKPKDRLLAAMLEASRKSGSSDSNGCCSRSNT